MSSTVPLLAPVTSGALRFAGAQATNNPAKSRILMVYLCFLSCVTYAVVALWVELALEPAIAVLGKGCLTCA